MKKIAILAFAFLCVSAQLKAEDKVKLPSYPPETAEQRDERLNELYKPLSGTYVGSFKFKEGSPKNIDFTLTIYVREEPVDQEMMPVLLAYYQRADDKDAVIPLTFDVVVVQSVTPAKVMMQSRPFPGPPNQYRLAIEGAFTKDGFVGKVSDFHQGRNGDVILKKVKK